MIIESIMKSNKAGTGKYLQLVFQILEGPCKGRRLFARLNLENPSPMAVQIARAELSAICRAVNVMAPLDSTELHQLPLQIYVALKVREDTSELGNEIKGYAAKDAPPPNAASGLPA